MRLVIGERKHASRPLSSHKRATTKTHLESQQRLVDIRALHSPLAVVAFRVRPPLRPGQVDQAQLSVQAAVRAISDADLADSVRPYACRPQEGVSCVREREREREREQRAEWWTWNLKTDFVLLLYCAAVEIRFETKHRSRGSELFSLACFRPGNAAVTNTLKKLKKIVPPPKKQLCTQQLPLLGRQHQAGVPPLRRGPINSPDPLQTVPHAYTARRITKASRRTPATTVPTLRCPVPT